jgi:integrase
LCDRYTGADGKVHKVSVAIARDTPQQRRKASEELQRKIASKSALTTVMPLSGLVEAYLSHKDVKPSTRSNYEYGFKQIIDILGDIETASLTVPYALRRFSESRREQSTINRYILLLNGLLAWAYQYGYIGERMHISPVREKSKKKDAEYLEADELKDVLGQLEGTMAGYVCRFLVLTGCRIGEASALTWDDIDDRYVHITKAYKYENGVSTPKTEHSVRDVFIQPELRTFLREYRKWRLVHMTAYGIRSDLLFFSEKGTYYDEQYLLKSLQRVKSSKHIHPHIFRHTHTALLAEQGLSLEAISRRLGHSSSQVTKDIYFHVTEKLKQRDEEALSKVSIL